MRKLLTLVSLILIGNITLAQDDAVLAPPLGAIISPASGCVLSTTESVTVRIFNSGPGTINSPFDVSFNITGPIASFASETVPVGVSIPPNSSYLYTFTGTADLSSPGAYSMDATVTVVGDPNAANNTYSGYSINLIPNSVGGTITGPASVCISGNSGFLTLGGNTGSVLGWEYSTDGGSTWVNISNTSSVQSYNNLTVPTIYRVLVQNGSCPSVYSAQFNIAIDAASASGTLTPSSATVCLGSSSPLMTLGAAGRVGSIIKWQYSTDGGATYIDTAVTTNTLTYPSITVSPTRFRVVVQNGTCASVNSNVSVISASPVSVAGTITGGTSVCSGSNSGSLTLAGNTGAIQWQFSTNPTFATFTVGSTTSTQTYLNLTTTTYYRARVTSGACSAVFSNTDSIVVLPAAVGGTLSAPATVCSGSTSGLLTLSSYTGTISSWEVSVNGGAYSTIVNTLPTYTSGPLASGASTTFTYDYRVRVMNGTCGPALSSVIRINVNPPSVGGVTAANDTVCGGINSGTITLTGKVGAVTNWQSSTDGITWTSIANTTTSQAYTNLATTTYYQANVTSGVCPSALSTIDTITVNGPSVGGAVTASANVCYGSNSGTLNLSGETGNVIRWEYSIDGGINWVAISNTTTSYSYANIILTTQYRAVVQNGTCSTAISSAATLTVDPVSVGGTISGSAAACGGSNSGTLDLISYVGTIQGWESSTDGGVTWTAIANTTATENYLNVLTTTVYHVIVTSGVCASDTSATATITVDPPSDGGTLSMEDTVCASSNFGVLTVVGYTGTIQNWQSSTDGGITWLTLANTTASQTYMNLMQTTSYRVYVKSGVCNGTTSNIITIMVDPVTVGGTISGGTTVCDTINSGTLTLTGNVGQILNWESSTDAGLTWSNIINTTTTQSYTNLTDTTWFRAIVSSGLCGNDTSSVGVIIVNPATVAGMVSTNDTVCTGLNNGTLYLTGYTGAILGWEQSVDGGFNWIPIANTSDSLTYNNLTVTTMYHANVKSGICNADTSISATITVNPVSDAGTITGAIAGCEGANAGTLTASGTVGTIVDWESSIDAGTTWVSLVNTASTQTYLNLTDTTWYRVIVQSGVCSADTSDAISVIVYPKPIAMFTTDTVCFGNPTTFTNTSTISSGFIQFNQWDFGDGNNSLSPSPTHTYGVAGTYSVTLMLTSNQGCLDTATVSVLVNALPPSTITASGPLNFCPNDTLTLSAAVGGYDYMWSTTDTTSSIIVTTSGTFVLTITDSITGCMNMDSVTTILYPSPSVSAGADIDLSLGSSIDLEGSGTEIITWFWFPNTGLSNSSIANPTAAPIVTTMYTLTGTDANGCTDVDTMTITVIMDYNVTISNLMTPNDDGFNDRWIVQNVENYPDTKVIIVNREGQEVFSSDSYDNNWDGTSKAGKKLPDGTYYYIIQFRDDEKVYKGAITILSQGSK